MKEYKRLTEEELNDFTSRVVVQLEPTLTQQVMSLILELTEYRTKIENGTLIELPCIREVNTVIAKYEVVYINKKNLTQSTLVDTKKNGCQIVSLFGNDYCKAEAEQKLKELREV